MEIVQIHPNLSSGSEQAADPMIYPTGRLKIGKSTPSASKQPGREVARYIPSADFRVRKKEAEAAVNSARKPHTTNPHKAQDWDVPPSLYPQIKQLSDPTAKRTQTVYRPVNVQFFDSLIRKTPITQTGDPTITYLFDYRVTSLLKPDSGCGSKLLSEYAILQNYTILYFNCTILTHNNLEIPIHLAMKT